MANLGEKANSAKMVSVPKIHQGFGQIFKWDNKKGHLDKWRFYENDKFEKNLFKVWQKLEQDDKRGMLIIVGFTKMTYFAKPANMARIETMRQQNSHIDSWRFSQKWQMWENGQESTHDLVKPQMRWQRGEDWQKANFDKYVECAKNSSRAWPNIQMTWQKGPCW